MVLYLVSTFSFIFLFSLSSAEATTFGPIPLAEQIREAQYFVHGKIVSASWVEMDRKYRKPFTYWKLQIIEQNKEHGLSSLVDLRQPGGEIGDLGYRVAGSAQFKKEEEVFLTVRDSSEENVKDLIGLMSGKYTREGSEIRSGLGMIVRNADGSPMLPNELMGLAKRVALKTETKTDQSIFLNRDIVHDEDTSASAGEMEAFKYRQEKVLPRMLASSNSGTSATTSTETSKEPNPNTEEKSTGASGWSWWVIAGVIALLGSALFLTKKS